MNCLVLLWIGGLVMMAPVSQAQAQIRTYSVPKEHPDPAPTGTSMSASDIPVVDFKNSPIHWTVPGDWKTLAPNSVRLGNFAVEKDGKKAEVAVDSFPGSVGEELDNVNRWRQQVGLAAVSQNEIAGKMTTVDGSEGKLYDLSGPSERILVAAVPREGNTWFFKMRGDKGVVGEQEAAFLAFLKSVTFNAKAAGTQSPASLPNSAPPNRPTDLSPAQDPHAGLGTSGPHPGLGLEANEGPRQMPKWKVPAQWKEKAPGPMVFQSFSVPNEQGPAATVSISVFPGDVGGVLANVNRWRGQLGLAPVNSTDLPKITQSIDAAGGKAVLVDLTGSDQTGQPGHLIAAIVPRDGSTWFYKIMGDGALVAREKENFVNFVQTVQYP